MLSHPFGKKQSPSAVRIPPSARANMPRYLRAERSIADIETPSEPYASKSIAIPLVIAIAAALMGVVYLAQEKSTRRGCVDATGVVVPDTNCATTTPSNSSSYYPYRWHYGGSYNMGRSFSGGSYTAPVSSQSSRGIFGGSGSHYGGGYS